MIEPSLKVIVKSVVDMSTEDPPPDWESLNISSLIVSVDDAPIDLLELKEIISPDAALGFGELNT